MSWTAYHKSKSQDRSSNIPTVNVLLPLIDYKSSAIELQHHLMKISVAYTTYLNPGQIAVGCSDLPLYALKKIIQMSCADVFSDSYFAFMGGLHIEQAALVCIGQLIKGTGMGDIISASFFRYSGLRNSSVRCEQHQKGAVYPLLC